MTDQKQQWTRDGQPIADSRGVENGSALVHVPVGATNATFSVEKLGLKLAVQLNVAAVDELMSELEFARDVMIANGG